MCEFLPFREWNLCFCLALKDTRNALLCRLVVPTNIRRTHIGEVPQFHCIDAVACALCATGKFKCFIFTWNALVTETLKLQFSYLLIATKCTTHALTLLTGKELIFRVFAIEFGYCNDLRFPSLSQPHSSMYFKSHIFSMVVKELRAIIVTNRSWGDFFRKFKSANYECNAFLNIPWNQWEAWDEEK